MPRFCANLSLLFTEQPFVARYAAAAGAGFTGVECHFPYGVPAGALAGELQAHQLEQVLFNLPPGNWAAGERGIACLPDRVDEFEAGVWQALDYARVLGCRRINCLAGLAPDDADRAALLAVMERNVRFAARALSREGIELMIEPINTRDMPGFLLNQSAETLALIERVGEPNVKLQYDVYHMQIMEGDLARTLQRELARIGHVQIADNPGRHEPGSGEINYPFLFDWLDRIGYTGWVSAEYLPAGNTTAGLGWMRDLRDVGSDRVV
ncbi:hydroxypyruvate isomerase [Methyloversatilis sp. XJ19-49]|uniref:hydroxypyruvate isomerase n=1 Tax=Methyloversatilis sp. XJ19-49 TaxID=2963429 RepID=UPI00211BB507|nr:hydroxypyruvate isomerase [Methyloversatilis sp. XJ19-49]MCQ9376631.1 hydroxypyruvate isomerase [Methyloversatilis sp. XJ19-49]